MPEPHDKTAPELRGRICLKDAAAMHPHLSKARIEDWTEVGLLARTHPPRRIYLPLRPLGGRKYVDRDEFLRFLKAMEPNPDPALIEEFSR